MTNEQMNLLHGLSINGGRMAVSGLTKREEFAEYEASGWLAYRHDGIWPYMELTDAGRSALAQAVRSPSPEPHK